MTTETEMQHRFDRMMGWIRFMIGIVVAAVIAVGSGDDLLA